jgi:TolB protein
MPCEKRFFRKGMLWLLTLMVLCGWSGVSQAERVVIDFTNPGFQRIPIAIPDFKYQTSEQTQLAREMGEALAGDLDYSGVFRPLDPKGFLEDPQTLGMTAGEIKFPAWQRLGADYLVRAVYQVQGGSLRLEARLFNVVTGQMVLGKIYESDTRNWSAVVHRFADEILMALTGDRGVFDTKIAYTQAQGKNKEIFVVDFDGSNPVQLTHDQSLALGAAWSNDGNQIAYASYKDGNAKIFVSNLLNGSQRLLCGHPGINISPAWRPGANQLAVTLSKGGNPEIYLVSSSGEINQRLVQGYSINVSPTWSPDGRQLAYVSDESGSPQIYVLDVGSGRKRRISFGGNYNTSPAWSPKGDWIAFSSLTGGHHNILICKPDGSEVRHMTNGEGNNESPSWSPDGRMIAFSSTRQGGSAIWVLLTNGTGVRRLTRTGSGQELPDWSPRLGGR